MNLALVALLISDDPAKAVLNCYATLIAKNPAYSVQLRASTKGAPDAVGSWAIQRPSRQLFRAEWRGEVYSYSQTERGTSEINESTRIYDEFDAMPHLYPPRARVANVPAISYPYFLLTTDLKYLVPPKEGFRIMQSDTINGSPMDRLVADVKGPMASVHLEVTIDSRGEMRKFLKRVTGDSGTSTITWQLSGFKSQSSPKLAVYQTPIPLGFVPYALPSSADPIEVGQVLRLGNWIDVSNSKAVNLSKVLSGKTSLLAILGVDTRLNQASNESIKRLKNRGVNVVPLLESRVHGVTSGYYDPLNQAMKSLSPPATPMFVLIDGAGKVKNLWLGIDSDGAADFEKDVMRAVQNPNSGD